MSTVARLIQTENGDDEEIIQTVEAHYGENKYCDQYAPSGDDSPPLPEDRVVLLDIEGTGNCASVGVLAKSQGAEPGEKILYSRDEDGNVKAKIHLKKDGSVVFEGEGDAELTIKGGVNITVKGDAAVKVDGKASVKADGNVQVESSAKTIVKGSNVEVNGNVKITGGTCEVGGVVTPSGMGALCALPFCAFTGAPQSGKVSSGT